MNLEHWLELRCWSCWLRVGFSHRMSKASLILSRHVQWTLGQGSVQNATDYQCVRSYPQLVVVVVTKNKKRKEEMQFFAKTWLSYLTLIAARESNKFLWRTTFRKFHVHHYLFTLLLDFDFWCTLIGLNLTVDKLSSLQGSCRRQPQIRKMRAGSSAQRFTPCCRRFVTNLLYYSNSQEAVCGLSPLGIWAFPFACLPRAVVVLLQERDMSSDGPTLYLLIE